MLKRGSPAHMDGTDFLFVESQFNSSKSASRRWHGHNPCRQLLLSQNTLSPSDCCQSIPILFSGYRYDLTGMYVQWHLSIEISDQAPRTLFHHYHHHLYEYHHEAHERFCKSHQLWKWSRRDKCTYDAIRIRDSRRPRSWEPRLIRSSLGVHYDLWKLIGDQSLRGCGASWMAQAYGGT